MRRVKSLASVLSHLKPVRDHFGDWRAVGITFRAIEAYITTHRQDEKSNATINREWTGMPGRSDSNPNRPRPAEAAPSCRKVILPS